MTQIAKRNGRLLQGGEPDLHSVAVNIINDWQRGKLPFFVPPPAEEGESDPEEGDEPDAPLQEAEEGGEEDVPDDVSSIDSADEYGPDPDIAGLGPKTRREAEEEGDGEEEEEEEGDGEEEEEEEEEAEEEEEESGSEQGASVSTKQPKAKVAMVDLNWDDL
jgi:nuclear GTP-binding protein